MTEMDKFRAILKKNNTEHSNDGSDVYIRGNGHSYHVWPIVNSYLCESIFYITAEQAASIIDSFEEHTSDTCTYIPDESGFTWWDENDNEHYEEDSASYECVSASCNKCGFAMMAGDVGWFGESGTDITVWYDEGGTEHHGYILVPNFNFCPNCGRKVKK